MAAPPCTQAFAGADLREVAEKLRHRCTPHGAVAVIALRKLQQEPLAAPQLFQHHLVQRMLRGGKLSRRYVVHLDEGDAGGTASDDDEDDGDEDEGGEAEEGEEGGDFPESAQQREDSGKTEAATATVATDVVPEELAGDDADMGQDGDEDAEGKQKKEQQKQQKIEVNEPVDALALSEEQQKQQELPGWQKIVVRGSGRAAAAGRRQCRIPPTHYFNFYVAVSTGTFDTYDVPEAWDQVVAQLCAGGGGAAASRAVVCGPQESGKSTLCLYLLNSLLSTYSSVAIIDCDTGQPEFNPPMLVSLHLITTPIFGPTYCHLRKPLYSAFAGDITPASDPEYYLCCVNDVLEHASRLVPPTVPLIVNTNGWIYGIGRDMLYSLVRLCQPTHVISIAKVGYFYSPAGAGASADGPADEADEEQAQASSLFGADTLDELLPGQPVELLQLQSTVAGDPRMRMRLLGVPKQRARALVVGEYLGTLRLALAQQSPYTLPWAAVAVAFVIHHVPSSQAFYSLNGSLVALCASEDASKYHTVGDGTCTDSALPAFVLGNPGPARCVGLGVVQSVDPDRQAFNVVTPLTPEELRTVNLIVKGAPIDTTDTARLFFIPSKDKLVTTPYSSWNLLPGAASEPIQGAKKKHGMNRKTTY
eukprot:TRINITY_DN4961_c0_g1_i1.p1 TRINITY_DN4961_c0_g1~~TRINITY_DN4961_c0_g1_i1.p1  ORF type:complete len:734 (-),score=179.72 TRINITY_DN4961_c0_g1_i1:25-1962(-)